MRKRLKYRCYDAMCSCEECDFEVYAKNAIGLAAQHFNRTGHTIRWNCESHGVFTESGSDWQKEKEGIVAE